ncbi:MAG: hypothetical protein EB141_10090 [Verrucomicrobia bacterium]|nr:hypothetical protein [Verrucomicrobiota bacterium]NBU08195.1 hypothetical protein [Pseudomonadota bacterium]NDA67127.1 hypothetical protein [Verrucomicrobiota bacterium]NDB75977.1 hypothetical protein [Verrucomicrobiota bacterium]NDD37477.1 hypothetical protein [Verrucomicrobiota bacterium]
MKPGATKISAELAAQSALTAGQRDAMFQLLTAHFDGVARGQFEQDLAEKNWVLLLARGERLVGFTTLLAYETEFAGEPLAVIYSGDTIVAAEAWGSTLLPRAWIAAVNQVRASLTPTRCVWLLLTSGFRTYRFLPVFWREFWPRWDVSTPPEQVQLLEHLACERFGPQFNPTTGLVRFDRPQRLCDVLNHIPAGRATDPHIAFFLGRNPGHVRGDELVCLTEIALENLTPAGWRMVNSPVHEFSCDTR